MLDYRKAKKGETTCSECKYSRKSDFNMKRLRCTRCFREYTYAVGSNHTCNGVEPKKEIDQ